MTDVEHISRKGTGVPVSWFPVPEETELPEGLRGLFRKARQSIGFVPNVFRAYSYRPERLSAWFAHYRQLHEPTDNLDAAEREMIAVAVSMANGCLYCQVAHGAALREALGDPILADRITLGHRRGFPVRKAKDWKIPTRRVRASRSIAAATQRAARLGRECEVFGTRAASLRTGYENGQ
jgi:AhpD family alkylhydroperoxidase